MRQLLRLHLVRRIEKVNPDAQERLLEKVTESCLTLPKNGAETWHDIVKQQK